MGEVTSPPTKLTSHTFEEAIGGDGSAVAVAFLADWCAPCRLLRPTLTDIASQLPHQITMAEVDVDAEPGLASRYHVEVLPTVVAFRRGCPVLRLTGSLANEQLLEDLSDIANPRRAKE